MKCRGLTPQEEYGLLLLVKMLKPESRVHMLLGSDVEVLQKIFLIIECVFVKKGHLSN
jgi:hypothetical protein